MVIPVIVNAAPPLLVSVTFCGPLITPTVCEPNAKLGGNSVTAGSAVLLKLPPTF